jgi:hypothetical protein
MLHAKMAACGVLTVYLASSFVVFMNDKREWRALMLRFREHPDIRLESEVFLLMGVIIAIWLWMLSRFWAMARRAKQAAAQLPYVPPVTPSTLPAEEVLVRGATEPPTPNETLLRPAVNRDEKNTAELLRSSLDG